MGFSVHRAGQSILQSLGRDAFAATDAADSQPTTGERVRHGGAGQASIWMLALTFILGGGALVALGIRFPSEAARWMETRQEIQQLRQQNADLMKLREEREERLRKYLDHNDSLELEIRRQLDLHHPDETIYVMPPKSPAKPTETPQ